MIFCSEMRKAKRQEMEDEKKKTGVSEVKREKNSMREREREMGMLLLSALSAFSLRVAQCVWNTKHGEHALHFQQTQCI